MFTNLVSIDLALTSLQADGAIAIDCRFSLADPVAGEAEYQQAHIPNARYAHLDRDLSSAITPTSGRHPLPDPVLLAEKFGQWGIDTETQLIAYDSAGGAFASRLWWLARWIGHQRVAVLDGGWQAWNAAGMPVDGTTPNIDRRTYQATVDDSMCIGTEQLARDLSDVHLIDARGAERFRGEVEPIDPIAGHVRGAVNIPYQQNLQDDGHFQSAAALAERFADAKSKLANGQPVACMCGSGVTACHNLLAMDIAGITGAKLYAGSWSEWIRDSNRPVSTGV